MLGNDIEISGERKEKKRQYGHEQYKKLLENEKQKLVNV